MKDEGRNRWYQGMAFELKASCSGQCVGGVKFHPVEGKLIKIVLKSQFCPYFTHFYVFFISSFPEI